MGGMMIVLNPPHFVPLYKSSVGNINWGGTMAQFVLLESLTNIPPSYWLEKKGNNLLWEPSPSAVETAIELLVEARIQRSYKSHLMVVP